MHVLENEQPSHQPRRQWRLPRPGATDRTKPSRQETPINLRREPHQRMAKVDDLLQSGTKQIVLAVVAWLAHGCPPDSESRRRRNHEPPKSEIPKRKKTATTTGFLAKWNIAQVKPRRWINRFEFSLAAFMLMTILNARFAFARRLSATPPTLR